jgi:hypothetical protein
MMRASIVLLVALVASIAHAQAESDLERGRAARASGDHVAALAAFSAAWTSTTAPVARAEMAIEELALGHYVLAEAHAIDALAFTSDAQVSALAETLAHTRDEAATHLGSVEVVCPEGCVLTIDGAPAGTTPLAHLLRAAVGAHSVHAELEDYSPADASFEVAAGAVARVTLAPVYIDDRPILQRTGGTGDGERIAGIVGMAVGGASLVVGAIALGIELDRDGYIHSGACAPTMMNETREQVCPDAASLRNTYTDVARNMLLLGGALLVTGLVFYLVAPSDPVTPTVACAPSLSPGVVCEGRF